ncbi:MAG: hypothetical protein ACK5H2_09610 [Beutenbergiaceae bacterium]
MNDVTGWVLAGIGVLIFAYIVPAAVRSRQLVVDSRVDDRYSDDLRIVATAGHRPVTDSSTERASVHPRQHLLERPMTSPDAHLDAASARRLAAIRAARAAATSTRAAAARRRLLVTGVLAAVAAAAWSGFAWAAWPLTGALVATAALVGVVVLGRRAAKAGQRAEQRWAEQIAEATKRAHARADSGAGKPNARIRVEVDPTALITAPIPTVPSESDRTQAGWTPIPVPPPAYTLKPTAPRQQVQPIGFETESVGATTSQEEGAVAGPQERTESPEPESSIDVQAVLARRRRVS